jgi:hypothetical protein
MEELPEHSPLKVPPVHADVGMQTPDSLSIAVTHDPVLPDVLGAGGTKLPELVCGMLGDVPGGDGVVEEGTQHWTKDGPGQTMPPGVPLVQVSVLLHSPPFAEHPVVAIPPDAGQQRIAADPGHRPVRVAVEHVYEPVSIQVPAPDGVEQDDHSPRD